MKLAELKKTTWYRDCLSKEKSSPSIVQLKEYALRDGLEVQLVNTDETGTRVWAIVVEGTDFWMDSFKSHKEAVGLCCQMGWKIV